MDARNRTKERYIERDSLRRIGLHNCGGALGKSEIHGPGWQDVQPGTQAQDKAALYPQAECVHLPQESLSFIRKALQLIGSGPPRLSGIIYLT